MRARMRWQAAAAVAVAWLVRSERGATAHCPDWARMELAWAALRPHAAAGCLSVRAVTAPPRRPAYGASGLPHAAAAAPAAGSGLPQIGGSGSGRKQQQGTAAVPRLDLRGLRRV